MPAEMRRCHAAAPENPGRAQTAGADDNNRCANIELPAVPKRRDDAGRSTVLDDDTIDVNTGDDMRAGRRSIVQIRAFRGAFVPIRASETAVAATVAAARCIARYFSMRP